jgi:hypothetical protein
MVILLGLHPEKKNHPPKRSRTSHPMTQCHIPENLNNIQGLWNIGLLLQSDASDLSL